MALIHSFENYLLGLTKKFNLYLITDDFESHIITNSGYSKYLNYKIAKEILTWNDCC